MEPARRASLAILVLGVAVRVAYILYKGLHLQALSFAEVEHVATSLVNENVFGNPYSLPTGPTAHLAPAYPWLVSILFRFFGTSGLGALSVLLFNALCASAQYALLVGLAAACGLSWRVGAIAGLAGAVTPLHPLTELRGWEASFIGMCWVVVLTLTIQWWRRAPSSWRYSALVGFAWGLLMLAAPQMLLVFVAVLAVYTFLVRNGSLGRACVASFALVLAILPWTVRNWLTFGHLFFIRSNLGLELSVSNHDKANPLYIDEFGVQGSANYFQQRHPSMSFQEAQRVQRMGEIEYQHSRLVEARSWIVNHPVEFLKLTLVRVGRFWFIPDWRWYKEVASHVLLIVAVFGLIGLFRADPLAAWLFLTCWIAFPLVYYIVFVDPRYRYPLEWSMLFLGAFAMVEVWHRLKETSLFELTLEAPSAIPASQTVSRDAGY